MHRRPGPGRAERRLRYCASPRFAVRFTGYSRQSVGNYQGQLLAVSCALAWAEPSDHCWDAADTLEQALSVVCGVASLAALSRELDRR
jgi:hypothetical protein